MANDVLFSLIKVDNIMEIMIDNDNITTSMFDGRTDGEYGYFKIVLVEACPGNIDECLDTNGYLDEDKVSIIYGADDYDGAVGLLWQKGTNADRNITIVNSSVSYDLADNVYLLKGAFLTAPDGTVLAYSINNAALTVKQSVTIPVDGVIWSIHSESID